MVVWRTDLLYLWDGIVCCGTERAVWGGWRLHLLMGMRMMGVLDVVGAGPGGCAAQRWAASNWLRVTTAALLSLTVLKQRHLKQQRRKKSNKYLLLKDRDIVSCSSLTFNSVINTDARPDWSFTKNWVMGRPHAPHQRGLTWKQYFKLYNVTKKDTTWSPCNIHYHEKIHWMHLFSLHSINILLVVWKAQLQHTADHGVLNALLVTYSI